MRRAKLFRLWTCLVLAASRLVQSFFLPVLAGGWKCKFQRLGVEPTAIFQAKNGVVSSEWISMVFGEMQPSPRLIFRNNVPSRTEQDSQCIIDNPDITLANPLLGLSLEKLTRVVIDTACKSPGTRNKPLLATVRGTGGGKTRLLEEIRQNLLQHRNVLPIAITFNCQTSFDTVEFPMPCDSESAALSIIARMASAFYGLPFRSVQKIIKRNIQHLHPEEDAVDLYTAFVQLIRQQMQQAGSPIETFVLMIDETVRLQNQLLEKYPDGTDSLQALRSVLLDQTHNAALVLSSLEIKINGVTDSGRSIQPLLQCEVLDVGEIVTCWWNITDSQLQHRFKLIAAVLCDLPRAVEMANSYIQRHRAETAQPAFATDLIQAVTLSIKERYQGATNPNAFPSPPLLKSMLFKSKYKVDSEVTQAIRDSLLTNVLNHEIYLVSTKRNEPVLFTPRVNLFMLAIRTGDPRSFSGRFLELLRHVIHTTVQSTDAEGDLLEMHTALMLNARVGVSMYSGSTVTLAELLGLNPVDLGSPLRTKIRLTEEMASDWKDKVQTLKYRCNKQASNFLEEIEAIEVSAEMPIALRFCAAHDSADILVKIYDASAPTKCQYAALDNKSLQETPKNANLTNIDLTANNSMAPDLFPKEGEQAETVCAVMSKLNTSTAYVYFTTYAVQQALYKPRDKPNVMWVYAGRKETEHFMGPLWDLHRTYREGSSFPRSRDQRKK